MRRPVGMRVRVPAPLHRVLEILRTVRMIVRIVDTPLVENRVALGEPCRGAQLILIRCSPGVVVEVIEQLGIGPANRDATQLTRETRRD